MNQISLFFHHIDWDTPLGWVLFILLILLGATVVYLIGPLPLIAYGLQYWAARSSSWDWKDRWASVRGFAVVSSLFFLLLCAVLFLPIPFLYDTIHTLWGHVPHLESFALWPPSPPSFLARWLFPLPLIPVLALLLERIHPLTIIRLTRILQPHEIAEIQQQQAEEEDAKRQARTAAQQAKAEADAQQKAVQLAAEEAAIKAAALEAARQQRKAARQLKTKKLAEQQLANKAIEEEEKPSQIPSDPPKPPIDWSKVKE